MAPHQRRQRSRPQMLAAAVVVALLAGPLVLALACAQRPCQLGGTNFGKQPGIARDLQPETFDMLVGEISAPSDKERGTGVARLLVPETLQSQWQACCSQLALSNRLMHGSQYGEASNPGPGAFRSQGEVVLQLPEKGALCSLPETVLSEMKNYEYSI